MENNTTTGMQSDYAQEETGDDPFLKRIQMQGKIIRKLLTQVDVPDDPAEKPSGEVQDRVDSQND